MTASMADGMASAAGLWCLVGLDAAAAFRTRATPRCATLVIPLVQRSACLRDSTGTVASSSQRTGLAARGGSGSVSRAQISTGRHVRVDGFCGGGAFTRATARIFAVRAGSAARAGSPGLPLVSRGCGTLDRRRAPWRQRLPYGQQLERLVLRRRSWLSRTSRSTLRALRRRWSNSSKGRLPALILISLVPETHSETSAAHRRCSATDGFLLPDRAVMRLVPC